MRLRSARLASARCAAALGLAAAATGCQTHSFYQLMPTPAIYADGRPHPFDDVPPDLQTPHADVLYVTNREPARDAHGHRVYTAGRSRSAAFGVARVAFADDDTGWPELVEISRSGQRDASMRVATRQITERGRWPATPEPAVRRGDRYEIDPDVLDARTRADDGFRQLVAQRLAQSDCKDVYLFIHGYNCDFEWSTLVIAQLWHFMGRPGVPVAFSWPAAHGGLIHGYQYDRESGEFSIFHLKRFLELLGQTPEIEKVHLIAHSRGADVATTALRELQLTHGGRDATRARLKLGTVVLAAADLDFEVTSQRLTAEDLFHLPQRFVMYVSDDDSALSWSDWLFDSISRIGGMRENDIAPAFRQALAEDANLELIDVEVNLPTLLSHSYILAHPAASSDLILVLRDERPAGAEHGRPLTRGGNGFWVLGETYPAPADPAPRATPSNAP